MTTSNSNSPIIDIMSNNGDNDKDIDNNNNNIMITNNNNNNNNNNNITIEEASVPTITTVLLDDGSSTVVINDTTKNNNNNSNNNNNTIVTIQLDKSEQELFNILRSTVIAYENNELDTTNIIITNNNNNNHNKQKLEIRVAGGWVRDKILQLDCHDIDIAINILTGYQFAQLVQQYMKKQHLDGKCSDKIGVIAANPEQSKHLETATMKIENYEIDFSNLRAEIYEQHSRIPTITFGTPIEDAMRRDFTINTLFYNVMSQYVEDWTKHGLQDLLINKQIVTPIHPQITFIDDPLRILRAIRFTVRYNFTLHNNIQQTAMCHNIHHALHVKVSRERVGKELNGMLIGGGKHANPILALDIIAKLKLAGSVFCLPIQYQHCTTITGAIDIIQQSNNNNSNTTTIIYNDEQHDSEYAKHCRELGWEHARNLLKLLPPIWDTFKSYYEQQEESSSSSVNNRTKIDHRLLPVIVFVLPFRKLQCTELKKNNNTQQQSNVNPKIFNAVTFMFKEGIKFKNADVQCVTIIMSVVDQFVYFITTNVEQIIMNNNNNNNNNSDNNFNQKYRLEIGLLLRQAKQYWVTTLIAATVLLLSQQQQQQPNDNNNTTNNNNNNIDWIGVSKKLYEQIINILYLDNCWTMRPLLDGKAVIKTLNLPRGPMIGNFLEEQMRWMLQNPMGTKDDCTTYLQSFKRKLEEGQNNNNNHMVLGKSDGTGPSSPVLTSQKQQEDQQQQNVEHFSKKMHVESMDI